MTLTQYHRSATVQGSEQEERALQHKFKQVAAILAVIMIRRCLRPSVSVPSQQTSLCSATRYEYGGIQLSLQGKYSSLHRILLSAYVDFLEPSMSLLSYLEASPSR